MSSILCRFSAQTQEGSLLSAKPSSGSIRLNTELGKQPPECLEYIIVHEMAHLLEPTHNGRFVALLDRYLSHWRYHREP